MDQVSRQNHRRRQKRAHRSVEFYPLGTCPRPQGGHPGLLRGHPRCSGSPTLGPTTLLDRLQRLLNSLLVGRRPLGSLQSFNLGQTPAPLAGPTDNVRSGAAFAISGMTEMGDDRIRVPETIPKAQRLASNTTIRDNTREGVLSRDVQNHAPFDLRSHEPHPVADAGRQRAGPHQPARPYYTPG